MFTGNIIYKINPFGYSHNHLEKCIKCGECYAEIKMYSSEEGRFCEHCIEFFNECMQCGLTYKKSNMFQIHEETEICENCYY